MRKRNKRRKRERHEWGRVSVLDLGLISDSRVSRGKQDSLPSFSPMARGTFDVVAHGMLLFIPPLQQKPHVFILWDEGPCYWELWRNTVSYVMYEMNGTNAYQRKASQRGVSQPGSEPASCIVLCWTVNFYSNDFFYGGDKRLSHSGCIKSTHTLHAHARKTHFQLVGYCHQCLSL